MAELIRLRDSINPIIEGKDPSSFVFCHNDLNVGNIIENNTALTLIDYEFAGMNFLGYELGNFFNELASEYEPNFQFFEDRIPS